MSVKAAAQRHSGKVAGGLVIYAVYIEATGGSYPTLPEWTTLAVMSGIVVAVFGYVGGGIVYNLLPEERGIFILAFEAWDDEGGAVYELSEDQFSKIEVVNGTLHEWQKSPFRVYECKTYNPTDNIAVGNWRDTDPASSLASKYDPADVMDRIEELRQVFEPEGVRGKLIRRRLPGILRELDRQRAIDQAQAIEPHMTPTHSNDTQGVDDVIHDQLPDELLPERLRQSQGDDSEHSDESDVFAFDLLDDETEAIEPVRE